MAEELISRGWHVEFACSAEAVPLARSRLRQLSCRVVAGLVSAADHLAWMRSSELDAVVIDSYSLPSDVSASILRRVPVLAFVDGSARGQSASLYVDQNFGAEARSWPWPEVPEPLAQVLAGTDFAIVADAVRSLRPANVSCAESASRVVISLGGTDAAGLTKHVVDAVMACDMGVDALVVSPGSDQISGHVVQTGSVRVECVEPDLDFPALLASADAVISAAGTTLWEICCLGKPAASLALADNQVGAYAALASAGVVFGLGDYSGSKPELGPLAERIAHFISNGKLRDRLANAAYGVVDGAGRERVADAFSAQVAASI